MRLPLIGLLGLVGCGGANPLTLLDELRVLDITVVPASPAPEEVPLIDALVVDPTEAGFETWSWWCQDGVCGQESVTPSNLLEAFVLACAPDACEGPGDELADPAVWLAELPIEGVSFARRTVPVSASPDARLNSNPTITPVGEIPETVAINSTTPLNFSVQDTEVDFPVAYGFATRGGFRIADGRPVMGGQATVDYVAPEEPGEVDVYVIVQDGLGGSASWSGQLTVE